MQSELNRAGLAYLCLPAAQVTRNRLRWETVNDCRAAFSTLPRFCEKDRRPVAVRTYTNSSKADSPRPRRSTIRNERQHSKTAVASDGHSPEERYIFVDTFTQIRAFGGDPEKVTIWGQSAGAGSVLQHVVARNGKTSPKLFRAAITSSTFLHSQYKYDGKIPLTFFNEVASQAGCNGTRPLDCLREVDSATLAVINTNIILTGFAGTFTFSPVVDGSVVSIVGELLEGNATRDKTDASRIVRMVYGRDRYDGWGFEVSKDGMEPGGALDVQKEIGNEVGVVQEVFVNVLDPRKAPGALKLLRRVDGSFIKQSPTDALSQGALNTYVRSLFPLLGAKESSAAASLYESLGSSVDLQKSHPPCSDLCLPHLPATQRPPREGVQGRICALHGDDTINYFSTFGEFGSVLHSNNTAFITAFTQGFVSFAAHLDPNAKLRPSIAPCGRGGRAARRRSWCSTRRRAARRILRRVTRRARCWSDANSGRANAILLGSSRMDGDCEAPIY
ncbi:Alpha/Beta hydrolase protein [Mycena albidolilacea]|uniref:Carboxylic ester hydrolase n=1 Tax=Mycena albidolilacea TaxID=1033008 RepID=A0AAD7AS69_9AGAR|nr:Alpha/Beta hydrolase protein [Mycena albidolilacea]